MWNLNSKQKFHYYLLVDNTIRNIRANPQVKPCLSTLMRRKRSTCYLTKNLKQKQLQTPRVVTTVTMRSGTTRYDCPLLPPTEDAQPPNHCDIFYFLGVLFIIKYSVRCFILNMNLVMLHFYMVHEKMSKLFILVFVFLDYICLKSVCYFSFIHVAQLYVHICFYLQLYILTNSCLQKRKKFCSQLT